MTYGLVERECLALYYFYHREYPPKGTQPANCKENIAATLVNSLSLRIRTSTSFPMFAKA